MFTLLAKCLLHATKYKAMICIAEQVFQEIGIQNRVLTLRREVQRAIHFRWFQNLTWIGYQTYHGSDIV